MEALRFNSLAGEEAHKPLVENVALRVGFVDTREPLSSKARDDGNGENERGLADGKPVMWYVVKAGENAVVDDANGHYVMKDDDCFIIPDGKVPSIGKGWLVCEVVGQREVSRPSSCFRQAYVPEKNRGVSLVQSPSFNASVYDIDRPLTIDIEAIDTVFACVVMDGSGKITDDESHVYDVVTGDTLLFPSSTKEIQVDGRVKLLTAFV